MSRRLYWVDLSRFDTKPNKSPWLEMAKGLNRAGFTTCILTSYRHQPYEDTNETGIDLKSFRSSRRTIVFRLVLLTKLAIWLARNLRRSDVLILPPGGLYLAPWLRLLGHRNLHLDFRTVPVEVHGWRDQLNRFVYWYITVRMLSRFCSSFSFITVPLQRQVESEFSRNFSPSIVWQSGVNTRMFEQLRSKKGSKSQFVLFYHGTITRNRGLKTVVRALSHVRRRRNVPIVLKIVGAGSGVSEVLEESKRQSLESAIDYRGLVPYENIPEELAEADCCVCPLPDRPEWNVSSPLKVFEYLAARKPMILTRIAAHQSVLGDSGFVVWADSDDDVGIAGAIESAYDQRDKLRRTAAAIPGSLIKRFDWEEQSRVLASFLDVRYAAN